MKHKEYPWMEGDYFYDPDGEDYGNRVVEEKEANAEAHIHFIVREFEKLLVKYGFSNVRMYMTEEGEKTLFHGARSFWKDKL